MVPDTFNSLGKFKGRHSESSGKILVGQHMIVFRQEDKCHQIRLHGLSGFVKSLGKFRPPVVVRQQGFPPVAQEGQLVQMSWFMVMLDLLPGWHAAFRPTITPYLV